MKFRTVLVVAVALALGLVMYAQAQAATAYIPATSQIQAVKQATQQYGWPHTRTLAETVGIPLTIRFDLNRYFKDNRRPYRASPVSCYWRNTAVLKPRLCKVSLIKRGQPPIVGTVKVTTIFEDGSYVATIQ